MAQPPFQPFGGSGEQAEAGSATGAVPPNPQYAQPQYAQPQFAQPPATAYAAPAYGIVARPNVQGGTAALVFGLLGLLLCPVLSIPGMIMGRRAMRRCDEAPGYYEGRGVAVAGFVTGLIGVIMWAVIIAFYAFFIIVGMGSGAFESVPN